SVAKNQEQLIQEQQAWIAQLEQGKAWLEEQWASWQSVAKNQEQLIQEQQAWIAQLEQGKAWLEGQLQNRRMKAERLQEVLEHLGRLWVPQSLRRAVKNFVRRKLANE